MQGKITWLLCGLLACSAASGDTYKWTSGWGMGVSEHMVDDGNANELNISCPDYEEDGAVRAHATIAGKQYSFDVIVDGEHYSNPFFTDCRACGANFPDFWKALRQANRLQLVAGGRTINLPASNIGKVLAPLDSPENSCRSAW